MHWRIRLVSFYLTATAVQTWLSVTVRLRTAVKHEIQRSFIGDAVEAWRHVCVQRVAGVLTVYDGRHLLKRGMHLICAGDAMV